MRIERGDKRANFTVLPNHIIEDTSLSFRARGILAWVLSKPDDWWTNSEMIAEAGKEGRDAVRSAMKELVDAGYLRREKRRQEDGKFETVLLFFESPPPTPGNPASVDQSSESQASNQEPTPSTETNSSLRSEESKTQESKNSQEREIATAYWDWHKGENGGSPAQDFKALMSIARACLKREYTRDEILDGMKRARRAMSAATVIDEIGKMTRERESKPSTAAIPTAVVIDLDAARGWFDQRWPGWYDEHRIDLFESAASMIRWGFGVGETMLRIAVAMHSPPDALAPSALSRIQGIDNFKGRLADIPATMEQAYRNRHWYAA